MANRGTTSWEGYRGGWELVLPAGQRRNLMELAVREGYGSKGRALRVGLDVWGLMLYHIDTSGNVAKTALDQVLRNAASISGYPVVVVPVFDGPLKANEKRNVERVKRQDAWSMHDIAKIVRACGWKAHWAPGEAEAELSALNRRGYLDYVISHDSNVFSFGATDIIQTPPDRLSYGSVHVFANCLGGMDLPNTSVLPFRPSWASFLFLSITLGSDYTAGLPGCDTETAAALSLTDLPEALFKIMLEFRALELDVQQPLVEWHRAARTELIRLGKGSLVTEHAFRLWPSLSATGVYEGCQASNKVIPWCLQTYDWAPTLPHSLDLASLAAQHCISIRETLRECKRSFWSGHAIRQLAEYELDSGDTETNEGQLGAATVNRIINFSQEPPTTNPNTRPIPSFLVRLDTSFIMANTVDHLLNDPPRSTFLFMPTA